MTGRLAAQVADLLKENDRMRSALNEIRELAAEAIVHDMVERGLMDGIRNAATAALGDE